MRPQDKTHCVNGHEFTPENTIWQWRRQRQTRYRRCLTCKREIDKIYNAYKRKDQPR